MISGDDLQKRVNELLGNREACATLGKEVGALLQKIDDVFNGDTGAIRMAIENAIRNQNELFEQARDLMAVACEFSNQISPGHVQKQIVAMAAQSKDCVEENIASLKELLALKKV